MEREILTVGDLQIDTMTRLVSRGGEIIDLTNAEFQLLFHLAKDPGAVVAREFLFRNVLGRNQSPSDRSIDNHVSGLRRKLGPHVNGWERIRAIRSVGYLYLLPPRLSC